MSRPAYQPTSEEQALQAWVRLVLSAYDTDDHTVEVIYANQAAPRPELPYATLQVISGTPVGEGWLHVSDTPGDDDADLFEAYTIQHHTGTVSINVFGALHREMMASLVLSLRRPDVREAALNTKCWPQRPVGWPRDLSQLRDTSWEGRSQCDFIFTAARKHLFEAEGIDSVAADLTVDSAVEAQVDTR